MESGKKLQVDAYRQRTRETYVLGLAGAWVQFPFLWGSLNGIGSTNSASVVQKKGGAFL